MFDTLKIEFISIFLGIIALGGVILIGFGTVTWLWRENPIGLRRVERAIQPWGLANASPDHSFTKASSG